MYLKYFLEYGIFAQDSKDSESRTLFYFVTDPSEQGYQSAMVIPRVTLRQCITNSPGRLLCREATNPRFNHIILTRVLTGCD